jgi:hypothetical protein
MNNTEKLLRAFIEASGYDIKELPPTDCSEYMNWMNAIGDSYTTTDYKVTKKQAPFKMKTNTEFGWSHPIYGHLYDN